VVQAAVKVVIGPLFEASFRDFSFYGYHKLFRFDSPAASGSDPERYGRLVPS
jgi:hypothetical protein